MAAKHRYPTPLHGNLMSHSPVRLTQYSHGAGCGCKIAPDVLAKILATHDDPDPAGLFPQLLVGNQSRDDAAAVDLGDGRVILSTTDFFMPIVDDPFDFGRIAATNAISDIYAMGGRPLAAIAILGWPLEKLPAEIAGQVLAGGRQVCTSLGFPLAGGHSIDCPEPIFGLAVTGEVRLEHLKRNDGGQAGDVLFLTKPLGIGIHTTAEKQGKLASEHQRLATDTMCLSNRIGAELADQDGVHALTDVTGFGLLGHLLEMCQGAGVGAEIRWASLPLLDGVAAYIAAGAVPGGCERNFTAYGHQIATLTDLERSVLCDPQTSGGLLISAAAEAAADVSAQLAEAGLHAQPIGQLIAARAGQAVIQVAR